MVEAIEAVANNNDFIIAFRITKELASDSKYFNGFVERKEEGVP